MNGRRLLRAWFYLRSFFRRPWTLEDYPVVVRRQDLPRADAGMPAIVRDLPPYVAMVDGMMIAGVGDTPDAARAQLAQRFEDYRASHDRLPRPGTQAPITFASTARLEAHGTLRDEFIERVLHMEPDQVFVSDASSLSEFPEDNEEYGRRIMLLYGVDIDGLADDKFPTILDALAARPARGGRV
jgi:hypothetical protein